MTDYPDHEQVTQYLLGKLPSDAAERLDELSVSDDGFAAQLNEAENDLVDAYARGELSTAMEGQFRTAYSTPKRQQKVAFAQALVAFQQQTGKVAVSAKSRKVASERHWWPLPTGWLLPQWGLVAAVALFIASAYLAISNQQLQRKLHESEAARAALTNQQRDLEHQVESKSSSNSGAGAVGQSLPSLDHLKIATFMLAPSRRGSAPLPTVTLSSDTELLVLRLELESTSFPKYVASVEDPVSRRSLWQSTELTPADSDRRALSFAFPPSPLVPGTYIVELKGIRASGSAESLSTYPFRVVLR